MDVNMERFAEFMARMIEKYADEIDIETEEVSETTEDVD